MLIIDSCTKPEFHKRHRYSDLPKRNHRTQECNDFTENFTRELQIPTRSRRKVQKNLLTGNDSYRKTKFKNNDKKKIKMMSSNTASRGPI